MDFLQWAEKLLPALISFIGAWFGSRWGFKKYKMEKFWDAKVKAYSSVLISVENIAFWGLADEEHKMLATNSNGALFNDNKFFKLSMRELISLRQSHSLYFSRNFNELLKGFIDETKEGAFVDSEILVGEDEYGITDIFRSTSNKVKNISERYLSLLTEQAKEDIGVGTLREKLIKKLKF